MHVSIRLEDEVVDLSPGDLIGRLWSADLCLAHPEVSELHAYVTLRDGTMKMLPLRGRLWVHGLPVDEITLEPGLEIEFAPGAIGHVTTVTLPNEVFAVRIDDVVRPLLRPIERIDAQRVLWTDGQRWFLSSGELPQELVIGEVHRLGHREVELQRIALGDAVVPATRGTRDAPLRIEARFDSVLISQEGQPVKRFAGLPARLFTTIAEAEGPIHWEVAAREIWPPGEPSHTLRRRWDRGLYRLRVKLEALSLPSDFVRTAAGQAELVLGPDDTMIVVG